MGPVMIADDPNAPTMLSSLKEFVKVTSPKSTGSSPKFPNIVALRCVAALTVHIQQTNQATRHLQTNRATRGLNN
eukprot:12377643-Heterocapsa_arctica.AAC.1